MSQFLSPNAGEWLVEAAKKNPEGLLLLAAGACLLLRSKSGQTERRSPSHASQHDPGQHGASRRGSSQRSSSQRSSVEQGLDDAREFASDAANRAKDAAETIATSARNYASQAARTVGEQSERVAQRAQSTATATINRILQEQPLAIAAAGVAAGAMVAAVLPATDFERAHLGPYGEQLTDAAQRMGGQFKDATAKAGEALKTAAEERGLTADGLKEVASEVASTFGETMKGGDKKGAGDKMASDGGSLAKNTSADFRPKANAGVKKGSDHAG
jgi:ElaB/YqjD/DUF883 family membrane-anchored ribosome-binding protein